jgi:hypothetical protein
MANTSSSQSHNQPSREAQSKGGQHSHQGTMDKENKSGERNTGQNQSGKEENQGKSGQGSGSHGSGGNR